MRFVNPSFRRLEVLARDANYPRRVQSGKTVHALHSLSRMGPNGRVGEALFNVNSELFFPEFVSLYWEILEGLSPHLSDGYRMSAAFEAVYLSSEGRSGSPRFLHLAKTHERESDGSLLRVAGGLFTSEMAIVSAVCLHAQDRVAIETIGTSVASCMRPESASGYDVLVLMLPVKSEKEPTLDKQADTPWLSLGALGGSFRLELSPTVIAPLSRIERAFRERGMRVRSGCFNGHARLPPPLQERLNVDFRMTFRVIAASFENHDELLDDCHFWSDIAASAVADRVRLRALGKFPGHVARRRELWTRASVAVKKYLLSTNREHT